MLWEKEWNVSFDGIGFFKRFKPKLSQNKNISISKAQFFPLV